MIVNDQNIDFLRTAYSAAFAEGRANGPAPMWSEIATEVDSTGAKNLYSWLGDFPELRELVDEKRVKDMKNYDYTLENKDYEATVAVKKNEIQDNTAISREGLFRALGERVNAHDDKLIFELLNAGRSTLCYDGQNYFDTDHPTSAGGTQSNLDSGGAGPYWYLLDTRWGIKPLILQNREDYELTWDTSREFMRKEYLIGVDGRKAAGFGFWHMAYASNQTLNETNFNAAYEAMGSLTSDDGSKIDIRGTKLVVPMGLRAEAMGVVKAQTKANGATNTNFGAAELLVTSYLPNS